MIDIENEVLDLLWKHLEETWPGIDMSGDTVNAPPSFPCVGAEMVDNYPDRRTQDSVHPENPVINLLEVAVFSNKVTGRKQEAKAIAADLSDFLQRFNFTRISMTPAPVPGNGYYRLVLRFRAEVSATHQIYRR